MQRKRCSERGRFGVMAFLAVLDLPRDERAAALGEVEDLALQRLPVRGAVGALDRRQRGRLRLVIALEVGKRMRFPAVRYSLDRRGREGAQVVEQPARAAVVGCVAVSVAVHAADSDTIDRHACGTVFGHGSRRRPARGHGRARDRRVERHRRGDRRFARGPGCQGRARRTPDRSAGGPGGATPRATAQEWR